MKRFLVLMLIVPVLVCGCSREASKAAAALRELPASTSAAQISLACGQIERVGKIPADLQGRCADCYLIRAKDLLADGKADIAIDLLKRAVSLGAEQSKADAIKTEGQRLWDAGAADRAAQAAKAAKAEVAAKRAAAAAVAKRAAVDAAAAVKASAARRRAHEERLRNHFLDNGMDVKVHVSGKNATVITLTYILFNDVWAHKMGKPDGIATELLDMGFKRVNLTDGNDYSVYFSRK